MSKPLDERSARAFMAQPHVKAMLDSIPAYEPGSPFGYVPGEAPTYEPSVRHIATASLIEAPASEPASLMLAAERLRILAGR